MKHAGSCGSVPNHRFGAGRSDSQAVSDVVDSGVFPRLQNGTGSTIRLLKEGGF